MREMFGKTLVALTLVAAGGSATAQDVVRLGNLKLAHFGAVSYIKEIAPSCGIRVEEKMFAKGLDIMQAIIAGELDVGATASEAAIQGRAGGAPVVVVAGFARGGARLVARPELKIASILQLKGKRVGVTRGGIQEVLLMAELARNKLSADTSGRKDVQLVYLSYPELNQALLGRHIDAMMQSEPQSSQAINMGFGKEVMKPYGTPIGEPVRTMVMTEKFYRERRPLAEKFMRCFVRPRAPSSTGPTSPNTMCASRCSRARSRWPTSARRWPIRRTPTTSRPSTSRSRPTSWRRPGWGAWRVRRWPATGSAPTCWPRPRKA